MYLSPRRKYYCIFFLGFPIGEVLIYLLSVFIFEWLIFLGFVWLFFIGYLIEFNTCPKCNAIVGREFMLNGQRIEGGGDLFFIKKECQICGYDLTK